MTEQELPVLEWWEWLFVALIVCGICGMMWIVFKT